jgi:hypothetical protein
MPAGYGAQARALLSSRVVPTGIYVSDWKRHGPAAGLAVDAQKVHAIRKNGTSLPSCEHWRAKSGRFPSRRGPVGGTKRTSGRTAPHFDFVTVKDIVMTLREG